MTRTIRAKVTHGALTPLEPLGLPDGSEVDVTVAMTPTEADIAASKAAAGGWRGKVDADALMRNIYADRQLQTRPVPRL